MTRTDQFTDVPLGAPEEITAEEKAIALADEESFLDGLLSDLNSPKAPPLSPSLQNDELALSRPVARTTGTTLNREHVVTMGVLELKECCRQRGLKVGGIKADLQSRLLEALSVV
jgi:hypothetical protein